MHVHHSPNSAPSCAGIGLLLASWLGLQDAPLLLLGRSGRASGGLALCDLNLSTLAADVASGEALSIAAQAAQAQGVAGLSVYHAAGVLQDGLIARQKSLGNFQVVSAPKVAFAEACAAVSPAPLTSVCFFSSIAAFLGSPGQAVYAAANSMLDRYASRSQLRGLPGQSVQWGAWSGVGMAHGSASVVAAAQAAGLGAISPALGLQTLEQSLSSTAVCLTASPFNFGRLTRALQKVPGIFEDVLQAEQAAGAETRKLDQGPARPAHVSRPVKLAPSASAIEEDLLTKIISLTGRQVGRFEGIAMREGRQTLWCTCHFCLLCSRRLPFYTASNLSSVCRLQKQSR